MRVANKDLTAKLRRIAQVREKKARAEAIAARFAAAEAGEALDGLDETHAAAEQALLDPGEISGAWLQVLSTGREAHLGERSRLEETLEARKHEAERREAHHQRSLRKTRTAERVDEHVAQQSRAARLAKADRELDDLSGARAHANKDR